MIVDLQVRAGAVDIVRHWQDLGYLIIYVTGRPCMQLRKVNIAVQYTALQYSHLYY